MMKNIFTSIILLFVVTVSYSQNPCSGTSTVTFENKVYHTVQIGAQCWLKENIDAGIMIAGSLDQTNNNILEKYCYDDDPSNCEKYGGLYNWNEAMKYTSSGNKMRGICPVGWRLPTMDELKVLQSAVDNDGSALKDVTQGTGTSVGTNTSGFSALLAGSRGSIRNNGSHFSHLRVYAFYWSSTDYDPIYAFVINLDYSNNTIGLFANGKEAAFSVRCLQDETTSVSENFGLKEIPVENSLSQNYPNPFNPTTKIHYSVEQSGSIIIKVFDITGREVETIVNEFKSPGTYSINFDGSNLSSGIYYYQMNTEKFVQTRKFVLVK